MHSLTPSPSKRPVDIQQGTSEYVDSPLAKSCQGLDDLKTCNGNIANFWQCLVSFLQVKKQQQNPSCGCWEALVWAVYRAGPDHLFTETPWFHRNTAFCLLDTKSHIITNQKLKNIWAHENTLYPPLEWLMRCYVTAQNTLYCLWYYEMLRNSAKTQYLPLVLQMRCM